MEQSGFHISKNGSTGKGWAKPKLFTGICALPKFTRWRLRGEGEIAGNGPLLVKPASIRAARRRTNSLCATHLPKMRVVGQ